MKDIINITEDRISVERIEGYQIKRSFNIYIDGTLICNTGNHGVQNIIYALTTDIYNSDLPRRIKTKITSIIGGNK